MTSRKPRGLIAGYSCEYVIADAAYDSDTFRAEIVAEGAEPVIRPRKSRVEERPYDAVVYKLRNVIERFFHRLKQYRRVATRYDKYAVRYPWLRLCRRLYLSLLKKCKHYLVLTLRNFGP